MLLVCCYMSCYVGIDIWRKAAATKRLIVNSFNSAWVRQLNKDGTFPSGKNVDDILASTLETLSSDKKNESRKAVSVVEDGEKDGEDSDEDSDDDTVDTVKVPTEWLTFTLRGPPAEYLVDDNNTDTYILHAFFNINQSNGPASLEQVATADGTIKGKIGRDAMKRKVEAYRVWSSEEKAVEYNALEERDIIIGEKQLKMKQRQRGLEVVYSLIKHYNSITNPTSFDIQKLAYYNAKVIANLEAEVDALEDEKIIALSGKPDTRIRCGPAAVNESRIEKQIKRKVASAEKKSAKKQRNSNSAGDIESGSSSDSENEFYPKIIYPTPITTRSYGMLKMRQAELGPALPTPEQEKVVKPFPTPVPEPEFPPGVVTGMCPTCHIRTSSRILCFLCKRRTHEQCLHSTADFALPESVVCDTCIEL